MGNFFYDIAINRYTEKAFLVGNPNLEGSVFERTDLNDDEGMDYISEKIIIEKSDPHDWYITSFDGLKLKAVCYLQKKTSDKWVIAVHGYSGKGEQMVSPALSFFNNGYSALIPDCRGHGSSEGNYIGMGWHDRLDVISWAEEIIKINPNAQIVLYGVSMGGAAVTMASGEKLPNNVKCIIEDCGYTSAYAQFAYQVERIFSLPDFPMVTATNLICGIRAGYTLKDASALKQVKKSITPTLFIHGSNDMFVPVKMAYEMYNTAACEKELLIINESGHGGSYSFAPENYWGKVFEFLNRYIKA